MLARQNHACTNGFVKARMHPFLRSSQEKSSRFEPNPAGGPGFPTLDYFFPNGTDTNRVVSNPSVCV